MSNKVPKIRFNGYSDAWVQRNLGEVVDVKSGRDYKHLSEGDIPVYGTGGYMLSVDEALSQNDDAIGIGRKGTIDNPYLLRAPFWTVDTLFYAIPRVGFDLNFTFDIFQKVNWRKLDESTGVPSLSKATINSVSAAVPSEDEQIKIGGLFEKIDNLIAANQHKLDLLKEQKKGYLQKMFPKNGEKVPELRFAGFADDWEERKFKDILKTYSFRSYLANASDHGKYEVIQQGDNPIVGYSDGIPFMNYKDVILFGDHTVSLYKPHSPFFISTDGVKILSADNFEGNYLYTTLERYKPDSQGYKRHFTILKNQELWFTRNMEEQQKVGSFFKQLDNNIALQQKKISLLKDQKKGLLQKMFI